MQATPLPERRSLGLGRSDSPSLSRKIGAVSKHLDGVIVGKEWLKSLRAASRGVPLATEVFGFECRLRDGDDRIDLGIAISRGSLRERSAGERSRLERAALLDVRWRQIRDFLELWAHTGTILATWVPFCFLEYDLPVKGSAVAVPSVFVALDSPLGPRGCNARTRTAPALYAARRALALLLGHPLSRELDASLARCLEKLPDGGYPLHVGAMLGRSARKVRLSVMTPLPHATSYLQSVGVGTSIALESATDRIHPLVGTVQLDFDLRPESCSRVGIGLRPQRTDLDQWQAALAAVGRIGSCSPRKIRALMRWPSTEPSRPNSSTRIPRFDRFLSHLKVGIAPRKPTEVKAYLGVRDLNAASLASVSTDD